MGLKHFTNAQQIEAYLSANMIGRIASEQNSSSIMACYAAEDGDHLEIGSLHGGSAILVALLKRELGLSGKVVCVDPLDGYYKGYPSECNVDYISKIPVNMATISANIFRFMVGDVVEIIQKKSDPWPLGGRQFVTAYIDGDHWGEGPLTDWDNVKACTSRYVIFDNCDKKHPAVMEACRIASLEWKHVYQEGITCVFERPADE